MKLEISAEEQKLLVECINAVVRAGGMETAKMLMPLHDKILELKENK